MIQWFLTWITVLIVLTSASNAFQHEMTEVSVKKVSGKSDYIQGGGWLLISELYAQSKSLDGKNVKVRGKVVKVSRMMGKNWVHIVDGTSSKANDRVVFTTASKPPAVGSVVTASGTLAVDKDFGDGYFYPVIMENATFK